MKERTFILRLQNRLEKFNCLRDCTRTFFVKNVSDFSAITEGKKWHFQSGQTNILLVKLRFARRNSAILKCNYVLPWVKGRNENCAGLIFHPFFRRKYSARLNRHAICLHVPILLGSSASWYCFENSRCRIFCYIYYLTTNNLLNLFIVLARVNKRGPAGK